MNNDLISRNALIEYFEGLTRAMARARCFNAADAIQGAVEKIKTAPAVDAEPVRHGWWIEYDRIAWLTGDGHKIDTTIKEECSNCGRCVERYERVAQENYCPSCGAKMDGDYQ